MSLSMVRADQRPEDILPLFKEYTDMILENDPSFQVYLDIQHYGDETAHLESKYGPPAGRLYLALWDGEAAGCVGLRRMDHERCELKRLYVRPAFRGKHLGEDMLKQVIGDARGIGYRYMLLDTLPFMESAIRLYKKFGFYEIPRYNDSPMETTIFMEMKL